MSTKYVTHKRVYRVFGGMAYLHEALCTWGFGAQQDSWFWRRKGKKIVDCKKCLARKGKVKGPQW